MLAVGKWDKAFKRLSCMTGFTTSTSNSHMASSANSNSSGKRAKLTVDYKEAESWGLTFRALMRHPYGRKLFKKYLMSEHAEENILFWEAVEIYRAMEDNDKRRELALDIYEEFIDPKNAKTEVSLDSKNREKVRPLIEEQKKNDSEDYDFPRDFFDTSQLHIFKLMESDTWRRFVLSSLYRNYLIAKILPETVETWRTQCKELLDHRIGRGLLKEFLVLQHADENIRFWEEVQNYKALKTAEEREERSREIYDTYIDTKSTTEISLDYKTRIQVEKRMKEDGGSRDPHLFDGAEQHIGLLIARDTFPRFVRSPYFSKFREMHRELREKHTEDTVAPAEV